MVLSASLDLDSTSTNSPFDPTLENFLKIWYFCQARGAFVAAWSEFNRNDCNRCKTMRAIQGSVFRVVAVIRGTISNPCKKRLTQYWGSRIDAASMQSKTSDTIVQRKMRAIRKHLSACGGSGLLRVIESEKKVLTSDLEPRTANLTFRLLLY